VLLRGNGVDSLTRTRYLRWGSVGAGTAVLAGLVVFHAMRPSQETTPEDEFADAIVATRPDQLTLEQREQLRQQWEGFPPEARARIFRTVASARLDQLRAETAALTPQERSDRIRLALEQMRRRRQGLSAGEREHIQQRLRDPQTQETVRQVIGFYRQELTARERAELDPLLQEWLVQIEQLAGRR
jgi:G3E family GTPase